MAHCEGFGHSVKYRDWHFKFYFFLWNKENDISRGNNDNVLVHQQNACSVLNTIIHKESHSFEKMWFYAYFLQKWVFLSKLSTEFTLMQLWW